MTGRTPHLALAHDWLVGFRGGEAVLESILSAVSPWTSIDGIYTMFDARCPLAPHIDRAMRHTSFLSPLPGSLRRWLLPAYAAAVHDLSAQLDARHRQHPIDLVVSTSSAAILGLTPPPGVPHLCYLHTPARYLWSQVDEYARGSIARQLGLSLWLSKLREADVEASRSVTRFISNSTHTANEARRCYGRDSRVIFPPVDTARFTPPQRPRRESFWLCVGALEPYKKTQVAMQAAAIAGVRLLVVGNGSQLRRLRDGAGDHVEFLTNVSNSELCELYRTACLLMFPQVEDFGIVAVEAQACGLPVVARNAGGARDTVLHGLTGVLCDAEDAEGFAAAAQQCPSPDAPEIRAHAVTFSRDRFEDEITREIRQCLRTRS